MGLIDLLTTSSVLIPLLVGIYRFSGLSDNLKLVTYFLFSGTLFNLASVILITIWEANTIPLFHVYLVTEFAFITLIYQKTLKGFISDKAFWAVGLIFLATELVEISLGGWYAFPMEARSLESVSVIVFCLLYFYRVSKEMVILHLEKEPMFWITIGLLLFFAGTLNYFLLYEHINSLGTRYAELVFSYIYQSLTILGNLLIAIGLWQKT